MHVWERFPYFSKRYTGRGWLSTSSGKWLSLDILWLSCAQVTLLLVWDEADSEGSRGASGKNLGSLCRYRTTGSSVPVAYSPLAFQWSYNKLFQIGFESCICYLKVDSSWIIQGVWANRKSSYRKTPTKKKQRFRETICPKPHPLWGTQTTAETSFKVICLLVKIKCLPSPTGRETLSKAKDWWHGVSPG